MTTVEGGCWLFGDDIDTDLILPVHAAISPRAGQRDTVFEANRPGWVPLVQPGDLIVAGRGFGLGSGRPAARALIDVGIAAVIASTVDGLFLRNAVAYGLPVLEVPDATAAFVEGDRALVDLDAWSVRNLRTGARHQAKRIPDSLRETMISGVLPWLAAQGYVRVE
ncbi:MAG: 3-isopropylmalate dehydratase [Actinophytocola sp.]|uniref:3-isopropylmalate dehydratase n=1 Tax=Actinophytocola sp. TaxID=1872138 RepID=UPI00132B48F1|nr:3-isopropylmalate dehydratase [Actinophytocola sp.]MPZ80063.1 3-isopropylmalate dehydratase [Actinophytocola sp.]